MISVVKIDTIKGVLDLISEQEYNKTIDRYRCHYVYRGVPDSSFKMDTSLKRNCKQHSKVLEHSILKNFTKYAALEDPTIEKSPWRQMILGQHYGLPTRLLDWSQSPLVGLHFAVTEPDLDLMEAHDCVVWRIDITELHSMLPLSYLAVSQRDKTTIFSVDMLDEVTSGNIEQYDMDMGSDSMVLVEPPSSDQRIVNQYSFFTVIPHDMNDIEDFLDKNTNNTVKYVISKDLRWRVRDMLDQLNMSERIVYPGLEGLSKWLGRHYFVKGTQT